MTRTLLFFSFLMFIFLQVKAQIHPQLYSARQEMFLEAESFFLFEEYSEALPLYIELLREQPGNSFLNYRAGKCLINIPGQKDKAIPHLEKAITDIDMRERRPTFRTTRAPADAYFYLGHAYHINYRFNDALKMYRLFRDKMNTAVYNPEVVEDFIRASMYAIDNVGKRVFFQEENLGERINSRFSDTRPAVSGNEKMLVFSRKLPFYDAIFFSEKTAGGEWSWPAEITTLIGCEGDCYPVSLSWDGRELYIYKSDDLVGNIYVSRYEAGEWSTIRKLNQNINTRHWESHASLSKNGDTLYFSSNRPGGFGGLDIYYSVRSERGDWGPALNMGPVINTPFNEDAPFISEDGRTLYFSSPGHPGLGGYDIFFSSRDDKGNWNPPVNVGYGINTPDDDLFFLPLQNGKYAYVSRFDNKGFGEMDIFRYEIFSERNPRRFMVTGNIRRTDGGQPGTTASVKVIDPANGNVIYSGKPNRTGQYEFLLNPGEWEVVFSESGYEDLTRKILLAADREDPGLRLNVELREAKSEEDKYRLISLQDADEEASAAPVVIQPARSLGIGKSVYTVTSNDKITISLEVEPGTMLEVEKYLDGALTGTESLRMDSHRFSYTYHPLPGKNLLRFSNTIAAADIVTGEVLISYSPPLPGALPEEEIIAEKDTVIDPDYFDPPVPDVEVDPEPGRAVPFRLILLLVLLILIVYYFMERRNRNKRKP
jgi:hypothetical protein